MIRRWPERDFLGSRGVPRSGRTQRRVHGRRFTVRRGNRDRSPELYGDGTQTRDFTRVTDVVRGLEMTADYGFGGIYNLGTGE